LQKSKNTNSKPILAKLKGGRNKINKENFIVQRALYQLDSANLPNRQGTNNGRRVEEGLLTYHKYLHTGLSHYKQ
jgi:hypothetical protein